MRALSYTGPSDVICRERADPRPRPNEVLIRMQAAGICRTGHSNVCINRRGSYGVGPGTADGADAEYMVVEAQYLFKVPEDFSTEDAAIVACQGGTAYYPLTRLAASGEDVLVVSGLGPVGLLATLFGSRMGAEVVGIDPSSETPGAGRETRREFKIPLGQIVHRELVVFGTSIFPTTQ